MNQQIADVAGKRRTVVLTPDFEAVSGVSARGRGRKPRKAYRRYTGNGDVPPAAEARGRESPEGRAGLAFPAARAGAGPRTRAARVTQLVAERLELGRLAARTMSERLREQPVRQVRVARQQRAVQIRADRAADAAAFEARSRRRSRSRRGTRPSGSAPGSRLRAAGVVLEAGDRARARCRAARRRSSGGCRPPSRAAAARRRACPRRGSRGSRGRAAGSRRTRQGGRRRPTTASFSGSAFAARFVGDEDLLAVLAAADVVEVVLAGDDRVVHPDRGHVEVVPPPGGASREDGDVAAVGVDVEVVRIEMTDANPRHAARSQYGFARPRSATIRCSASIAVYVGSTTSSPPAGVSSSPRSSARSSDGTTTMRDSSTPPYLKRSASSAARSPDATSVSRPVEQRLEVDVPDPRDVPAVGDRVVQRDDGDPRRATVDERAHSLVRAGRVLDQQEQQSLAVDRDPLEAPERGAEAGEAVDDLIGRRAERPRERRRAERVVDVVEAGERQLDASRPVGSDEVEGGALEAVQSHGAGDDVERAAGRGRSSGSGSRRGGRRRRPRSRRASRSGCSTSSRPRAAAPGRASTGRPGRRRRPRPAVGERPTCGSSPLTMRCRPGGRAAASRQRSAISSSSP